MSVYIKQQMFGALLDELFNSIQQSKNVTSIFTSD